MTIKRSILAIILATACAALVSLAQTKLWDGGFSQVEHRITFFDENDHPLKGVQLKVLNSQGNTTFGYPVTDFTDECVPASDENGTMIFHHVSLGMEFDGHCSHLFWLIPVGTCDSPKYTVQFLLSGQPIASFAYTDLARIDDWKNLPKVTRKWEPKGSSSPSLPAHLRIDKRIDEDSLPSGLDLSHLEFYVIGKTVVVSHR